MIRPRTLSRFRPKDRPDQSVLVENRKLTAEIGRRTLLRGTLSLGALSFLTGCNVSDRQSVQSALSAVSSFNDYVQQLLFDPNRLVRTYSVDQVVKPPRFNAYYDIEDLKPVDLSTWRLEFAGLIADTRPWTLAQFHACRAQESLTKHICVEGW